MAESLLESVEDRAVGVPGNAYSGVSVALIPARRERSAFVSGKWSIGELLSRVLGQIL